MASSSNFEFKCSYDIFLSFRGFDTRTKFTDHLYDALTRVGFKTFRDNEGISRGENIYSELQKAIWNSSMSVIVLSKTYATSKSCLFEIQTILEHRKKNSDHVILPVFYEVEPSEIKEQAKKLDFRGKKVTDEERKGWSAALKEVASMAGMVSGNQSNGSEVKFIEEIIGVLKSKQDDKHLRDLDENMQNLEREVEYLSGRENDINSQISKAECRPWKRPKREVEVWLTNVQRFKDDVRRLKQEVVGETNVSSRTRLGKDIAKKILEAQELHKKGRDFNSLMIDELSTGRLLIPPMKDFVKCTKARNIENIWECLMNDNIRQIGVYGMGGVGKTTIMKHIHNQLLEEKGMFDVVYWVTVSKPFNITNLQSDIAKSLNLPLREDEEETRRASQLYATLSEPKRYVLILDDVWEPFALDEVGIPEPIKSKGCKLVLTTRSLEVCRRMECTAVKVNLLTEEEALTLFLAKAVVHNTVLAPEVEENAAKIAKECACLPLAVVTVAGSLRGLEGTHKWRNALNELISSTEHANDDVSKVFEQLKFSYSRLENKVLQDCFLYCSLYPEDHLIPVNKLIEYWIAEELIADMDNVEAQLDKGHAILEKLTSSCLLESVTDIYNQECVRMHDLIRDMAIRITASNPRFMVKADGRINSVPNERWSEDLERISFMDSLISELPITPPVCPRLTTLLLCSTSIIQSVLEVIPDSFFTNMPCLQVLDLSGRKITTLPESISNLENLHALILRRCWELKNVPSLEKLKALKMFVLTSSKIEELLEGIEELVNLRKLDLSFNEGLRTLSISNLENLHSLILRDCFNLKNVLSLKKLKALQIFVLTNSKIEELPEGIEELVNLRELDLSSNGMLRTFPSWKLCRLSKLEYLRIDETGVNVSTEGLLCLRQLKVVYAHFHNVQEVTRYVISQRFQGLEKYRLTVGEDTFRSKINIVFETETESESDLGKHFTIKFDSVPFGSVVDQSVLPVGIESSGVEGFHDTISLSAIPCFKDAKVLSKCVVECCNWLESIFSSSTISEDGKISLRTVKTFHLVELPRLRVLFDGIAPPHNIYFNLQELHIYLCHALKNIFPVHLLQNFPNLKDLLVVECVNLEEIIVEKEEMSDRGNHQDYSNSISLPKLEHLTLAGLLKLKSIYNGVMVCPSIAHVRVEECWMVRRMPLSLHMDGEQATPPPAFKQITVSEKWWESLEWDDPLTKTILQPYVDYHDDFEDDYSGACDDDYPEACDDDYPDYYPEACDDDYPEESEANINRHLSIGLIDLYKSPDRTVDLLSSMSSNSIHQPNNNMHLPIDLIDLNKLPDRSVDLLLSMSSDSIHLNK